MGNGKATRRQVLGAVGVGFATVALPEWFLAEAAAFAPPKRRTIGVNDTINIGLIGAGGSRGGYRQGLGDARNVARHNGTKVIAVCDVDDVHRDEASAVFGADTKKFTDFRELLALPEIDAVVIGAPDHWHAVMSVMAMNAGKDVYCEKPLTLTIDEGKKIVETAKKTKAIFQTGSQQRSDGRFRLACELVRNGRIGKVTKVEAHLPTASSGGPFPTALPPTDFHWDLWLGPAPMTEYVKERTHGSFRWWYEYSGGMVTDWGAHHLDISQWGLGRDESGPVKVTATGNNPNPNYTPENHAYNVHTTFDIVYTYDDGVELLATNKGENGVKFIGDDGRFIFVSRDRIGASDEKIISEPLPENRAVKLYVSGDHSGNWLDGIRTRTEPICNASVGHRSVTLCHLGTTALRMGKPLEWNPQKQEYVGENRKEANATRMRPYRAGWKL